MKDKETILEVEGKTVQDAVKKALDQLKVKKDQIKVEILCEEEKGLFGMEGARPAKVRIILNKEQR